MKYVLKTIVRLTISFDKDNYTPVSDLQNEQNSEEKITFKPKEKKHAFKIQQKKLYVTIKKGYKSYKKRKKEKEDNQSKGEYRYKIEDFLALLAEAYRRMKKAS